jgi:hypothetical protein
MDPEDETLLSGQRPHKRGYLSTLCDTVVFAATCLWYMIVDREKYHVCVGNRKLDLYEMKMFRLQELNLKEMEKKFKAIDHLDERLRQSNNEFQSRMRLHSVQHKIQARQRGEAETFTRDDLEKRMTAAETRLKYQCISLRSRLGMERSSVKHIQEIQNDIGQCLRNISQWRAQLSTKEHIREMSDIMQGIDGEKLTKLGESCVNSMQNFLDELEEHKDELVPPDQEAPPKRSSAQQNIESEFWSEILSSAKVVPVSQTRVLEVA